MYTATPFQEFLLRKFSCFFPVLAQEKECYEKEQQIQNLYSELSQLYNNATQKKIILDKKSNEISYFTYFTNCKNAYLDAFFNELGYIEYMNDFNNISPIKEDILRILNWNVEKQFINKSCLCLVIDGIIEGKYRLGRTGGVLVEKKITKKVIG